MSKQTVKCIICGNQYKVRKDCSTDQAICPPCRWAEKNPKGKSEPLNFSGLKDKFRVGRL